MPMDPTRALESVLDAAEPLLAGHVFPWAVTWTFTVWGKPSGISYGMLDVPGMDVLSARMDDMSAFLMQSRPVCSAIRPLAPKGMSLRMIEGFRVITPTRGNRYGPGMQAPLGARRIPGGPTHDHALVASMLGPLASGMTPGTRHVVWGDDMSAHARLACLEILPDIASLAATLQRHQSPLAPDGRSANGTLTLHRFQNVAVLADQYKNIAWMATT